MEKYGYVYILASKKLGVIYTGVTNNLEKRIIQHKTGFFDGFTKKYYVHKLVWFQNFSTISEAIEYEKTIKGWKRQRKIKLIEDFNKNWFDLS